MKDGLKYLLLAAGAYVVYKSGVLDSVLGTAPASGAPIASSSPTGGGGTTGTPAPGSLVVSNLPTGGGGSANAPQTAPVTSLTPDQLQALTIAAAGGDAIAAAQVTSMGIQYNVHQWNWFRTQGGLPDSPAANFCPGDDPSQAGAGQNCLMTVAVYLQKRQALGLSGVTSLGGIPMAAFLGARF